MADRRSLRLSTRVTLFFGLIALLAGLSLTALTYAFARNSLVDQRAETARIQAFSHANELRSVLDQPAETRERMRSLTIESGGFAALTDPRLGSPVGFNEQSFPDELVAAVAAGRAGGQRFTGDDGEPYLGVGVFIGAYDTGYLEAFPLDTTERTLTVILTTLILGAFVATVFATFFGWSTSRRLLRPLSRVADAAGEIAAGGLGARLEPASDPDLARLAGTFNDMADAVQTRIEREVRFASDVSHELRSPITALSAAVEVLDARRHELPDRTQQALGVVVSQVRRFDDMVIDLLELSRIDAGATDLHTETVELAELCDRVAHRFGHGGLPIDVHRRAPRQAVVDRVRFERILGNLLENASTHGGGPLRISIEPGGGKTVLMAVEDSGPGVAAGERTRIFERFARGSAARHRVGTGLGLALVAEHAHALGGDAWVEERPGGGARFVVRLPAEDDR
ncbi:MAG: HAMP domain-containing sensor histidine kinase [Ilumatobacteraceae bacterium]